MILFKHLAIAFNIIEVMVFFLEYYIYYTHKYIDSYNIIYKIILNWFNYQYKVLEYIYNIN